MMAAVNTIINLEFSKIKKKLSLSKQTNKQTSNNSKKQLFIPLVSKQNEFWHTTKFPQVLLFLICRVD